MDDSIAALRAVLRLKAGLSPVDRLEDLTIDAANHVRYLDSLFATCQRRQRVFSGVVGPYGAGKTHFLLLAKEIALARGYAVLQLGQETGLGLLGHPHRHLPKMLSSLTLPSGNTRLADWLGACLEDPRQTEIFRRQVQELNAEFPEFAAIAAIVYWAVAQQPALRVAMALDHLTGTPLTGKANSPSSRGAAYRLLRFWVRFCVRFLGCRGVLLLIDELENLFHPAVYSGSLSRGAAYRSLSFYASGLEPVIALCALTPDGWQSLRSDIGDAARIIATYKTLLAEENVDALSKIIGSLRPYELRPLTAEEYRELIQRLLTVHAEARAYSISARYRELHGPAASSDMTVRIFSRSIMSSFEALWLSSDV